MNFKKYWLSRTPSEKKAIASALNTTVEYCGHLAYRHRRAGAGILIRIESATDGQVTQADLRPDLWVGTYDNLILTGYVVKTINAEQNLYIKISWKKENARAVRWTTNLILNNPCQSSSFTPGYGTALEDWLEMVSPLFYSEVIKWNHKTQKFLTIWNWPQ